MATAHQHPVRKRRPTAVDEQPVRKPRWRRRALAVLATVVVLVGLAPWIVAHTPLCNVVANALLADGQGHIDVDSASLGWFSPIELTNVDWHDREGERMLLVPKLTVSRSLGQMALDPAELGTVRIEQPELSVRLRTDGSNVEDVLAPWLEPTETESDAGGSTRANVAVQVIDAKVTIHDTPAERTWHIDPLSVVYDTSYAESATGKSSAATNSTTNVSQGRSAGLSLAATVLPGGGAVGPESGTLELKWSSQADGTENVSVNSRALPLAVCETLLARWTPMSHLQGRLNSQLQAAWQDEQADERSRSLRTLSVAGRTTIDQLVLAGADWGDEQLRLARLDVPCQLQWSGDTLRIDQLDVTCDVGRLAASGAFNMAGFRAGGTAAAQPAFQLTGSLDLAKIARMVPGVVNIRPGTTLTSGVAEVSLAARPQDGQQLWQATLVTRDLAATHEGQPIRWDEPIRFELAARQADSLVVDRLKCQSDFLQIEAAGNINEWTATGTFDLDRLTERLGQFVDLDAWALAGRGEGRVVWRVAADRGFHLDSNFKLHEFVLATPNRPRWQEPNLVVQARASGALAANACQIVRLDQSSAQLTAGDDLLTVQRLPNAAANIRSSAGGSQNAPGDNADPPTSGSAAWPIAVTMRGQLATWQPRLALVLPLDDWSLDGQLNLTGTATYGNDELVVQKCDLDVLNLAALGPSLAIAERQLNASAAGRYDMKTSRLELSNTELTSSAVAARADSLVVDMQGDTPKVNGSIAFQAAVERVQQWLSDPTKKPEYVLAGRVTGQCRFDRAGDAWTANVNTTGRDLTLWRLGEPIPSGGRSPDTIVWKEPTPTLKTAISFDLPAQRLLIESAELQSNTMRLTASGTIDSAGSNRQIDLGCQVDYDLARVTPLLMPYVGNGVQLAGRETAHFKIAGTLPNASVTTTPTAGVSAVPSRLAASSRGMIGTPLLEQLTGSADAGWQSANVYGLAVGPGRLEAQLAQGQVNITPIDLALGEGRLQLAPRLRLAPEPAVLTLPPGTVVDHVHVTPEVADGALKYISPFLARATQTEGQFSIGLQEAMLPFAEPRAATATGQLNVHKVRVSPGPVAGVIVTAVHQIESLIKRDNVPLVSQRAQRPLLELDERAVDFQLVNGRVYHRRQNFQIGEIAVATSGSVGLDQTLDLLVEVKIPDDLKTNRPLLENLQGETVKFRVGGTLGEARIVGTPIADFARQLLDKPVEQTIEKGLNRALDKLLRPRE